jgi:hypothetical protein
MRVRRDSAEEDHARYGGRALSRLGINAIGEPAAGRDEQLGGIFRNMRLSLRLSREGMARRLGIGPSIVDTFEAGVVTALPHWNETVRIVGGYCELCRVDPDPILWRISSQLQAAASHVRAATTPSPATASARPRRSERSGQRPGRRRQRARTFFALTMPIALLAGAIYVAQTLPGEVYRGIRHLPEPLATAARAGFDYLILMTAPRREGLRWLEAGDPQSRKTDKLITGPR